MYAKEEPGYLPADLEHNASATGCWNIIDHGPRRLYGDSGHLGRRSSGIRDNASPITALWTCVTGMDDSTSARFGGYRRVSQTPITKHFTWKETSAVIRPLIILTRRTLNLLRRHGHIRAYTTLHKVYKSHSPDNDRAFTP
jgi:hypothetical protein